MAYEWLSESTIRIKMCAKRVLPFLMLLATFSAPASQSISTSPICWKHVSDSYVGFPFDIALEDKLECFASEQQWVARVSVYLIHNRYFTESNLIKLFAKIPTASSAEKEFHTIAVSDEGLALWLVTPRLVGMPPEKDKEFQTGISRLRSGQVSIAEFYRIGENEGFWYHSADRNEESKYVPMTGHNPFHTSELLFPFQIVTNRLIPNSTGVECQWREVNVLLRPCDFSEENAVELLSWISSHFPVPAGLTVSVELDHKSIQDHLISRFDAFSLLSWNVREPVGLTPCPVAQISQRTGRAASYHRSKSGIVAHYYEKGSDAPRKLKIPQ